MAGSPTSPARAGIGGLRIGLILLIVVASGAIATAWLLDRIPDGTWYLSQHFLPFLFMRDQDAPWFAMVLVASLLLFTAIAQWRFPAAEEMLRTTARRSLGRFGGTVTLLVAAAILALGTVFVHHGFLYSMDEYLGEFQARIFASGRLLAELPPEWRDKTQALQPYFVYQSPDGAYWGSSYRPMFAAIRAAFSLLSLEPYTNAILSLLCLPLLARLSRRLWPEEPIAPFVASALLVGSTQFFITGMSGFSWPAHLLFSLLWLHFFLRDDTTGHLSAGALGFLALGLHQIHVHALFAFPFVLGLLAARRWRPVLFYGFVYVGAVLLWAQWHRLALLVMGHDAGAVTADTGGATGLAYFDRVFTAFGEGERDFDLEMRWPLLAVNMFRFIAWQSPLLVPLLYVACRAWRRAPAAIHCLGLGIVLTLLVHLALMPNAMHGWGYRYFHGLIGSFVLIATYGWVVLWRDMAACGQRGRIAVATLCLTLLGLLAALPMRAMQTEATVGPMAAAARHLSERPEAAVIVDHFEIWYGSYLFQNDPFLHGRPKVLALSELTPAQLAALCGQAPTPVLGYAELAQFGLLPFPRDITEVRPEVGPLRRLAERQCR